MKDEEPPFSKLACSNYKSYWRHAGQVKQKLDCGKFSLEFNSIRIAARKERPVPQQGQIHVENWIPHLRGLFSKIPSEHRAKREFHAL